MDNSLASSYYLTGANAIALPIFAAFAIVATYIPFRMLYKVGNIPVCTLIIVIGIQNLFTLLNTILWPNDNQSTWWMGYGLCDIEVELKAPLFTMLATSTGCITKSVADAVNINKTRFIQTRAMRHRKVIYDCLFCFAVPVLQMILHFLVQANRYAIAPVYGCADSVDNSWPTIAILYAWPPLFALLNAYYAVVTIYFTCKHRRDLSSTLSSTGSGMTTAKFVKLGLLSGCLLLVYLPITFYYLYLNIPPTWFPYSYSRIHDPQVWSVILLLHTGDYPGLQYDGWVGITLGFLICCFFGLNKKAREMYRGFLVKCGCGKIWPSLREPAQRRRGSTSRSSWTTHFDLVSKAVHYFDSSRKGSQATTGGHESQGTQSRKGSQGTFEHISLAHINAHSPADPSNPHKNAPTPDSLTTHPSCHLPGLITPAPCLDNEAISPTRLTAPQYPASTASPPTRPFLSTFRTNIHIPFSLLSRRTAPTQSPPHPQPSSATDLESQSYPVRTTSIPTGPTMTVESRIWSEVDVEVEGDTTELKMGTRAYRERERRELEKEKERNREAMSRIVVGNVRAELGLSAGGVVEREGKGEGDGGVVVKTSLERREEVASDSASGY